MSLTCAETTIANTSGGQLTLAMLGGKVLDDGETFSVPGDIYAYIAAYHPGLRGRANIAVFKSLVTQGIISVVSSPSAPCELASSSSSSA